MPVAVTSTNPRLPLPSDGCPEQPPPPGRLRSDHHLLELVRPLLASAGITRVADLTGLDDVGLPVVSAIRPNARSLSISAGKGATLPAATASAVMEALETYAGESFRPSLRLAAAAEIGVDLTALPRTAVERDAVTPILWCDGVDLVTGAPVPVPYGAVHLDWSLAPGPEAGWFVRDSNGLASGQTWEEAVRHGLCELIERDAARCHDLLPADLQDERQFAPTDPRVTAVAVQAAGEHRTLACWNLTGLDAADPEPIGVPVVAAVLLESVADPFRPLPAGAGLGAHPDPAVATIRAITEAAQSRLVTIAGARDDLDRGAFQRFFDADATEQMRQRIHATDPSTAEPIPTDGDLPALAQRVAEVTGHAPIVVDLTPPEWPVHVVRVLAPGLESALNENAVPGPRARSLLAEVTA